jgi:hypothetical protein
MESDDHLHKMGKQSNVEHNFEGKCLKTNIIEQTDLKSGTCTKEQCITIEDSDDEEDTQTNIELTSTTKKSQLNGNALNQFASNICLLSLSILAPVISVKFMNSADNLYSSLQSINRLCSNSTNFIDFSFFKNGSHKFRNCKIV